MVKGVTAVVCALLLIAVLAAVQSQAGETGFSVRVAKHKDGPYKVDIRASIEPGQTKSFWFRVRNIGGVEDLELVFDDSGTSDGTGFQTRWFKAGENVSSEVEGSGKVFRIDPGQRKHFNAKQTALDAPGAVEDCLAGQASIPKVTSDLSAVIINGASCAF
jgi:hypothetical protein